MDRLLKYQNCESRLIITITRILTQSQMVCLFDIPFPCYNGSTFILEASEMTKAVFFDLYNTLLGYDPPRDQLQLAACHAIGIEVDSSAMHRAVALGDDFWSNPEAREAINSGSTEKQLQAYLEYQQYLMKSTGVDITQEQALKIVMYMGDKQPSTVLFDDVLPALDALKKRSLTIGILSNVQRDTGNLLDQLGLTPYIDVLMTSREANADKPEPAIFLAALKCAKVEAAEAIHVGDQYNVDVVGARGVGIRPLLLDRYGYYEHVTDCPRISSLHQVVDYL